MPHFNVTWGGVVEAQTFADAEALAKRAGDVASSAVYAELGGLFCGMEYQDAAEDTDRTNVDDEEYQP